MRAISLTPSLFRSASELLALLLAAQGAADKIIEAYFRTHKSLGPRERGWIADQVYACLRKHASLEAALTAGATPPGATAAHLLGALLAREQGLSARALQAAGLKDAESVTQALRAFDWQGAPLSVRMDMPPPLAQALIDQLGEDEAVRAAQALNLPAPLDLRANTLKTDRDELRAALAKGGHALAPTPYAQTGLRRAERAPLFTSEPFKQGWFEVQDEGSQLLALLVEPKRQERVVDFCAGAGGKTLALAALMHNSGTLYAFDTAQKRLDKLRERAARAGADNIRTQWIEDENDVRLSRLYGKIDRVLVDAPCSGTGTLRRNPDIKWRPLDLAERTALQTRILRAAAKLMRPGGRLVYATCSVLREENEDIAMAFLAEHTDFAPVPAREALARRHIALPEVDMYLRLWPHRHGTDGFFAAVFERRER